jgi:hypothetical protein
VCYHWRALALSTPRLWENFSLRLEQRPGHEITSAIQEILVRSEPRPLFVDICIPLPSIGASLENTLLLAGRAESLTLHLPNASFESLVRVPENLFPVLHTLHIRTPTRGCSVDKSGIVSRVRAHPRLRNLILALVELPQPPDIFASQFPWSQLTYLNLGVPISVYTARALLAQCGQLVDVIFWV